MGERNHSSNRKEKRQPFKLDLSELAPETDDAELMKVQTLLERLDYLTESYRTGRLDKPTQTALKKYQCFQGLKQTGTTDRATVEKLEGPRCGTPDPQDRLRFAAVEFVLADPGVGLRSGCDNVGINPFTYTIGNRPEELPDELNFDEVSGAIERAFATWERVIPVKLNHTQGDGNSVFRLKFGAGAHGDGQENRFDTIGGLYAHAFYPGLCGKGFPGQCHFDKAERWGLNDDESQRTFDLETVALHEIGHLLGLTHSTNSASIMFDRHVGERRSLSADVIAQIQRIYGTPETG